MRSIRVGFCAAVIAAAGVAVAACGSAGPTGSAANPANPTTPSSPAANSPIKAIDAAYTSTTSAGTAKISVDASISGAQTQGAGFTVAASGVMDFPHKTGDLTMSLMGMDLEMRYLDGVQYMHAPSAMLAKDGGKPWVKIDLNELAKAKLGTSMGQLTSGTPTDPTQMLSYLRGMGTVTDKGPATIDGTPTEHYLAVMNVSDLVKKENLTADQAAQIEKVLGGGQVPMQVWIDQQNRLRQLTYSQNMDLGAITGNATGAGAGTVAIQETMKLSDFGVPVNVTMPPADQTADALNALGK
ncbi:MAG TPA: hypothetical protein VGM75_09025 [Pseudonocardiaceae bacterium]